MEILWPNCGFFWRNWTCIFILTELAQISYRVISHPTLIIADLFQASTYILFFHLHFFLVNVSTGNNGLKDIAWSQSWFSICNLCLWGGISFSAVPMRFEKDLKWHGAKSVLRLIIDYSSILFSILVKSWYKNYGSAIKCV